MEISCYDTDFVPDSEEESDIMCPDSDAYEYPNNQMGLPNYHLMGLSKYPILPVKSASIIDVNAEGCTNGGHKG